MDKQEVKAHATLTEELRQDARKERIRPFL